MQAFQNLFAMSSIIDKVAWLEIQDRKVLVARSYGKDKYYIPGGKREGGETDPQTLVREIEEELNVQLQAESLEFAGFFKAQAHGHTEGITVHMQCYYGKYEGTISPSSEIESFAWMNRDQMDQVSFVDRIIFNWLAEKGRID